MRYYRIEGRDEPVLLSEEHAALLDATPVDEDQHPARNASTEDWRAWAVLQGMDPGVADTMSRADIIATYEV